jgi:hypothetical protein
MADVTLLNKTENADPRIKLLNSIANTVPVEFHRDDGGEGRYYVYAWFHGQTCIYVGKGTTGRWLVFYVDKDYNSPEAHAYIRKHASELEPFHVVNNVTETAAFAIEYTLIGHFQRRTEGGTLFNVSRGNWPPVPNSDRALVNEWQTAAALIIPRGKEPLSIKGHWLATKSLPNFPPTAIIRLLSEVNPWQPGKTTGYDLFEKILRKNPIISVGEVLRLANEAGIRAPQAHLKWLFTWRQKGVFLEVDGQIWEPGYDYRETSPDCPRFADAVSDQPQGDLTVVTGSGRTILSGDSPSAHGFGAVATFSAVGPGAARVSGRRGDRPHGQRGFDGPRAPRMPGHGPKLTCQSR